MLKRLWLALLSTTFLMIGVPALAAPANISYTVGVCDPSYPQRCIKPDTNGAVPVTMGAVPTGGATAANQTAVIGTKAPGTAATNSLLAGAVYNSSGVTLTDGQQAALQVGANGALKVGGVVASGTAALGNPVPAGGVYTAGIASITTGQRSEVQLDSNANLRVRMIGTSSGAVDDTNNTLAYAQGTGDTSSARPLGVAGYCFDGSTWDRCRTVVSATNSTGTGIAAAGMVAHCIAAPTALTDANFGNVRIDCTDHALLMRSAGNSFTNITTNTDTVIKASAGTLYGLIINTVGTTSTATVYNNTTCTGAKIGTFSTVTQASLSGLNIAASVGICITTAGAGAADITATWR